MIDDKLRKICDQYASKGIPNNRIEKIVLQFDGAFKSICAFVNHKGWVGVF